MSDDELAHYSAALDEIYRLRTVLALQAMSSAADLDLKSFPKSRRSWAEKRVADAQNAACGASSAVLAGVQDYVLKSARKVAGMPALLTRAQWEANRGRVDA